MLFNPSGLPLILVVSKSRILQFERVLLAENIRFCKRDAATTSHNVVVCVNVDPIDFNLLQAKLNFPVKQIDADDIFGKFDLVAKLIEEYFQIS